MQQQFLRRPAVEAVTGLGRSTIYQMMSDGRFPKSVRIGRRAVAWTAEEIQAWLEERIAERSGDGQND
jgi:prophage regulatory protein